MKNCRLGVFCAYVTGKGVLAANQDKYVKAFTYRPLRVLIGNGLTSESGVGSWKRGRSEAL